MAENIINSRIMLKYDTLANWNSSTLQLKRGEVAIAEIPNGTNNSGLNPPAIGMKVGDGTKTFSQLPWIQAVAGDVYAWAKAARLSAADIDGLEAYIHGEINDTNTTYRINAGSSVDDLYKYYLEEKASNSNNWVTVSTIDLTPMVNRINRLENWAHPDTDFISQVGSIVDGSLDLLNVTQTTVGYEHEVVVAVSQNNGQVSAQRRTLSANDIRDGALPVMYGGTGTTAFPSGAVLIGNGTGTIATKSIDSTVTANSENLISSGAVESYVENKLSGVSGVMHFIGIAQRMIATGTTLDPQITGYNFNNAQSGDVVLYNGKEFVWTGTNWQELGDEFSFAVKGEIAMNDLDQSLQTTINNKVTFNELGTLASKNTITTVDLDSTIMTKLNSIPTNLHAIAYDGDVDNLTQKANTYITIDCGNSTYVV